MKAELGKILYQRKPIPGFSGYEADTDGNIWSNLVPRRRANTKSPKIGEWHILKSAGGKSGHQVVCLFKNNKGNYLYVHRLILLIFVKTCPKGMEACHNNGNPLDNHLENLRWDTHKNNMADRVKHGTMVRGERNGHAKLNKFQVQRIRLMSEVSPRLSVYKIAKIFKVSPATLYDVIKRKTWQHIM